MIRKIFAVIILSAIIFSLSFSADMKDILKQNIGHTIRILFKGTEEVESWGKIIDVTDEYIVTQYEKKTTYIRLSDVAVFIIDDDVTRKK
jgi:hypothetical protein